MELSKDYPALYDLVVVQGMEIPCFVDYQLREGCEARDLALIYRRDNNGLLYIYCGVRGLTYFTSSEFQVSISKSFKTVKDMFIRDCEVNNVEYLK